MALYNICKTEDCDTRAVSGSAFCMRCIGEQGIHSDLQLKSQIISPGKFGKKAIAYNGLSESVRTMFVKNLTDPTALQLEHELAWLRTILQLEIQNLYHEDPETRTANLSDSKGVVLQYVKEIRALVGEIRKHRQDHSVPVEELVSLRQVLEDTIVRFLPDSEDQDDFIAAVREVYTLHGHAVEV